MKAGTTLARPRSAALRPGSWSHLGAERKQMGFFCLYPDLGVICGTSLVFRFGNFPVGEN